jgi:hypothetical protein
VLSLIKSNTGTHPYFSWGYCSNMLCSGCCLLKFGCYCCLANLGSSCHLWDCTEGLSPLVPCLQWNSIVGCISFFLPFPVILFEYNNAYVSNYLEYYLGECTFLINCWEHLIWLRKYVPFILRPHGLVLLLLAGGYLCSDQAWKRTSVYCGHSRREIQS